MIFIVIILLYLKLYASLYCFYLQYPVSSTVDNVIWMMETYTYNVESPIHKSSTGRFSAVYKGTFGESSVAIKVLNGVPACGIGRKYVICYYMISYELILLDMKLSTKQLCNFLLLLQ